MNIFYKRPLSLILCIGLGGFFLFSISNGLIRAILCIIAILPYIISLYFNKAKCYIKFFKVVTVVLLIVFLLSFVYFDLSFNIYDKYDGEVEIVGLVEDVSQSSSYTMRLLVKVEKLNGRSVNYHVYAYPTKAEAKGIIEGARISFLSTLGGFSDESKIYNISNGINAYANDIRDINILEYTNGGIKGIFKHYRSFLSRHITMLTDEDSGALLSALLLGERELLPSSLRLAFKRIGISHILALSGMHLAILSVGIGWALTKLKIKKKPRIIITMVFIAIYMALTGFSVSVCRAGLMIILASVLFLLERPKDSLTSLTVAVTIICIVTPYAIYDISLWLSVLATFGIISYAEFAPKLKTKPKNKILQFILLSFITSMFAVSATMLISVMTFGGFSVLSLPATLIFSLLSEAIMYLGCITVIFSGIIPLRFIITPLTRILYFLAEAMSSFKLSYLSSNFTAAKVIIIIYTVVFFIFIVIKTKRPKLWSKIIISMFLLVMLVPMIFNIVNGQEETLAYYGQYKSDMMIIRSEGEVCLINSSQYSRNTGYDAIDFIEEVCATSIDKLYYTHYSWSIDDELDTILYNVLVDEIYLPHPRNDDEETILKVIQASIKDSNTEIVLFRDYETVRVGKYTINLLYSSPYGNTSMNAVAIAKRDKILTYISSGLLSIDKDNSFNKYLELSDYVILGDHGKSYKTRIYLDRCYEKLESLVVHSNNVFLNQYNMKYFIEKGCELYSHPESVIYFK